MDLAQNHQRLPRDGGPGQLPSLAQELRRTVPLAVIRIDLPRV
jgi:hypothetical protein